MNTKKLLLSFLAVFIVLEVTNYIVHGVILMSTYQKEIYSNLFRPEAEIESMMWIVYLLDLIWAFFFVFLFAKGYENKGVGEGIRFGAYIGIFYALVSSYQSYTYIPIEYALAFQWFAYGFVQSIILGIVAALIYKPAPAQ